MSWVNKHPEQYDDIVKTGVTTWLINTMNTLCYLSKKDVSLLTLVIDILYNDPAMAEALRDIARAEIADAESSEFSDRQDEQ